MARRGSSRETDARRHGGHDGGDEREQLITTHEGTASLEAGRV
jgi:hypothetical protein